MLCKAILESCQFNPGLAFLLSALSCYSHLVPAAAHSLLSRKQNKHKYSFQQNPFSTLTISKEKKIKRQNQLTFGGEDIKPIYLLLKLVLKKEH